MNCCGPSSRKELALGCRKRPCPPPSFGAASSQLSADCCSAASHSPRVHSLALMESKNADRPTPIAKAGHPSSRTEAVTMSLRDMITHGDFPPGFHVQEIPLAERLGVSRTPIREALATLAKEGL